LRKTRDWCPATAPSMEQHTDSGINLQRTGFDMAIRLGRPLCKTAPPRK
jgi:hypothetical protein